MGKTTKDWDRKFLGKVKDFESKEEGRFEQKHLDAYLKGFTKFTYGFEQVKDPVTGHMFTRPKWHEVKQELTKLT